MSDGRMTEEYWLYLLTPQVFVQHVSGLVGVPQTPISCPSLPSHRGSATAGGSSTTRRQTVLTVSSSDVPPTRPNNLTASPYTRVSTAGWLRGSLLSGHASLVLRPTPSLHADFGEICVVSSRSTAELLSFSISAASPSVISSTQCAEIPVE